MTAPTIEQLVRKACQVQASDIHLRVGHPPYFRLREQMYPLPKAPAVTESDMDSWLNEILTPAQRTRLQETQEIDEALFYPNLIRCRVVCFQTLDGTAITLRLIPLQIPSLFELQLPSVLSGLVQRKQGLILVTGPTGSGKSTTLAAMVNEMNQTMARHIITIEDPIEYVFDPVRCLITQREIGRHAHDFASALRAALRADPDVILVGEIRDQKTLKTAIYAAQTGHLVLGTLHARNTVSTIDRLIGLDGMVQSSDTRKQFLELLVAVISQQLITPQTGSRRAILEVLINTPAIQDYLNRGELEEAYRLMELDTIEGMQTLNEALLIEIEQGRLSVEEALKVSIDPGDLDRRLRITGIAQAQGFSSHFQSDF
ncbi:PilT/PilU family type 4a pilus ATPase [Synechococcus elongatus]|uniref:type IV pilus twitching motility protein PilT n=1 Tax=Synechococcus elongatus TaxID=32046 RepID=UPI0030D3C95E